MCVCVWERERERERPWSEWRDWVRELGVTERLEVAEGGLGRPELLWAGWAWPTVVLEETAEEEEEVEEEEEEEDPLFLLLLLWEYDCLDDLEAIILLFSLYLYNRKQKMDLSTYSGASNWDTKKQFQYRDFKKQRERESKSNQIFSEYYSIFFFKPKKLWGRHDGIGMEQRESEWIVWIMWIKSEVVSVPALRP